MEVEVSDLKVNYIVIASSEYKLYGLGLIPLSYLTKVLVLLNCLW